MLTFIQFIYTTFILPPGCIIIWLLALSFWLFRQRNKCAKYIFALAVVLYVVSNSFVAGLLIHSLEYSYLPDKEIEGDVIITLTGGATLDSPNLIGDGHVSNSAANRLLTVVQLYQKIKVPIIVSGGKVTDFEGNESEISKNILVGMGIPEDKIIIENSSMNTSQNAKLTKELLAKYQFNRPILVTSAFHMPRSVMQFEKIGVTVKAFPAGYTSNLKPVIDFRSFWPYAGAINDLATGLKEYIGILAVKYY
jgi:uncharacterized SAM-binding protein YcdF (DUF218 family)